MKNRIIIIFFLCYQTLLLGQENIIDPDNSKIISSYIGTILYSKGEITKRRQNEEISSSKDGRILSNDIIKTGKTSVVKIKMLDDTIITLGPETEFEISKFIFKGPGDRQSVFYLSEGQVRAYFPVKANEGDIEFKTKTTSIVVRGTTFLANVKKENNTSEQTEYLLLEGNIHVKNIMSGEMNSLRPGVHYILNKKGNENEEIQFEEDKKLLEELNATRFDEIKDLKPFLQYYEGKNVNRAAHSKQMERAPASVIDDSDKKSRVIKNMGEEKTPKWKNTLKELNLHLRRNGH